MLQIVTAEKVDEKNQVICLVSMFRSCILVVRLSKKITSVRNLSLFKQFTYMYLEGLVIYFQKVVLFIML